jgi:hypothetical protein
MDEPSKSNYRNEVLLKEYLRICDDIRSLESSNDRVVGLGATLVGASAAVAFVYKFSPVFLLLPFLIMGVLFFAIMIYLSIFSMGGYKRYLESLINKTLDENILQWEAMVGQRSQFALAKDILIFLYMITAMAIIILSVYQVNSAFGWMPGSVMAVAALILFVLVFISWKQIRSVGEFIYKASVQAHDAESS